MLQPPSPTAEELRRGVVFVWCMCVYALVGLCVFVLVQWAFFISNERGDYSLPAFFFSPPPSIFLLVFYIPKLPSVCSSPFLFRNLLSSLSPSLSSHPHPILFPLMHHPYWVSHFILALFIVHAPPPLHPHCYGRSVGINHVCTSVTHNHDFG